MKAYRLKLVSRLLRCFPPELPGKSRVARALLGGSIRTTDATIFDRYCCEYIVPSILEPIGFYLLIDGVYEFRTLSFLWQKLSARAVYVDIGANIGAFAIPLAKKVGQGGLVIALEPSPHVFGYLARNVRLNQCANIRARPWAAYDRTGMIPFYEAPSDHFGMGSLAAQFAARSVDIKAVSIDALLAEEEIDHVDVLKVDAEGAEAAVFRGAEWLLKRTNPPLLIFEFCDWAEARMAGAVAGDAQRLLNEYGYQIWRLRDYLFPDKGPLDHILTHGFETLVAIRGSPRI